MTRPKARDLAFVLEWCRDNPCGEAIASRLHKRIDWAARVVRGSVVVEHGWLVLVGHRDGQAPGGHERGFGDHVVALACGTNGLFIADVAGGASVPAALRTTTEPSTPDGFVSVDPWPQDVTFLRGDTLLQHALKRAAS